MLVSVFNRASEAFLRIIHAALEDCVGAKHHWVCTDQLLLAIARDTENIASQALMTMKIDAENAEKEVAKLKEQGVIEPLYVDQFEAPELSQRPRLSVLYGNDENIENIAFSRQAIDAFTRADHYSLYFGADEISPEHLLLALLDVADGSICKVLEELGANLTFLRRQVMAMVAYHRCRDSNVPTLQTAVIDGLRELISRHQAQVNSLLALSERAGGYPLPAPTRVQIVHTVCMAHMGELLSTQVTFQRYLLEESIRALGHRVGNLDREITATIVSAGAQNTRAKIRSCLEYVWCNEYRFRTQLLDEAEHDLIGTVAEDMWWAQSEEIALQDLFIEALDDHRRKQVLSLQKRRIEISQRLMKLRARLEDTIRQCFVKYSVPA